MSGPPVDLAELRDRRAQARERIGAAYADDLIDDEELERRLELVESAQSPADLEVLTADLPPAPTALVPARGSTAALARPDEIPAHRSIVALFSATRHGGQWTPARRTDVRSVCAAAVIDLRDARLGPGVTELHLSVLFGAVELFVPPGIAVESDCAVILGSLELDEVEPPDPSPDAPRIRLTGRVVMGSVEVHERLPGESARQARKRRKAEHARLRENRRRELPPA